MFATLERTWELAKQSFAVLRADKEILLFPVMSALAAIAVSLTFLFPLLQSGALEKLLAGESQANTYALLFVFYYLNYFIIIFFNSALVACANIRLSGGDPTVGDGLRIAAERIGRIALWALVASTVGLILRALEDRMEKLGRLVIALLGLAWTLLTYFIVPVIIFEDRSLFESVKRSAELFRRNWGTQVVGGFSFGLLFFLLSIPGFLLALLAFALHPLVGVAAALIYFLGLAAVASAIKGVFLVALYRYATGGEVSVDFSPHLLQGAFVTKH